MREFLKTLILILVLGALGPAAAWAQEIPAVFLPAGHVFAPLLADPREPANEIAVHQDLKYFDGELGGTLDLIRWTPWDKSIWGWGFSGAGFLSLLNNSSHNAGQSFRLVDIDLELGTYVSESCGLFSNRLEVVQQSSHLGDAFSSLQPVPADREGWKFTDAWQASGSLRLIAGAGGWFSAKPSAPPVFAQLGAELGSAYAPWDSNLLFRGYLAYDLKMGAEASGDLDQNFEAGFQWKGLAEGSPGFRFAVLYYNGDNLSGQFNGQRDNHWSFGFFVDP